LGTFQIAHSGFGARCQNCGRDIPRIEDKLVFRKTAGQYSVSKSLCRTDLEKLLKQLGKPVNCMKVLQNTLNKVWVIEYQGNRYVIDFLNSDGQTLALSNRNYWEVTDENMEEVTHPGVLIDFCIDHFFRYDGDFRFCPR